MIAGIGIDVIEVSRIRDVLARYGDGFLGHVFTDVEREGAPQALSAAASYYAGRWSAKEAVAKALGTGIGGECGWKDIEIVRWPSGQPVVELSGAGKRTAERLGIHHVHLTISHEKMLACASAVAER
ncbi:MAG: holo-ACP synthase [Candidatus Pacebacteria bacterium]|nr:holo-ACP synthase [Candidatus Paceibacterota bacterium]